MPSHDIDVAALDQVPVGGMQVVEIENTNILLLRDGAEVRALGGTCPHAGAPLAEGIRHGDRIVCPWHKAAFCIRSGAVLDPPAVDPIARYDARVENGRVLVSWPARAAPKPDVGEDGRCFVIVGAGAAGAVAAQTLRESGFGGRIVMLDRENRVPYDRTLLSKYVLSGEQGGEKSPLQKQAFYREHRIERRSAEVIGIDPAARRIRCANGTVVAYDAALLATGGMPRRSTLPGASLGNVFLLRSRADADALLAQAERSTRAVILGASFIGMEAAASLRERGLEVTVVGEENTPFTKQLGAQIGGVFVALHRKHGVDFRLGNRVAALEGNADVEAVRLPDGERLAADLVVIGFGVSPATNFAAGLPRSEDGGIIVDAYLRVADGLYAAGDIARFPHRGDGAPIRVEHWRVAQQHGRVAAMNMLGGSIRYDAVPVFWTIQYLKRLDYAGHAVDWDNIVVHGDLAKPEFLAYYMKSGHVAAVAGFDRDRDMAAAIELLSMKREWGPDEIGAQPAEILAGLGR
jgi:NADPH-dependent 2,4-dienoyl-CoA reductase/sulfur reductase-like enzyme/nitrite reductase/ring-hydroxylating ferredoxin subunit